MVCGFAGLEPMAAEIIDNEPSARSLGRATTGCINDVTSPSTRPRGNGDGASTSMVRTALSTDSKAWRSDAATGPSCSVPFLTPFRAPPGTFSRRAAKIIARKTDNWRGKPRQQGVEGGFGIWDFGFRIWACAVGNERWRKLMYARVISAGVMGVG